MRQLFNRRPHAVAEIRGSSRFSSIRGTVSFTQSALGVLVTANISGLPIGLGRCNNPIFAMHIHSGTSCTGNAQHPFADALGHFNPQNCPHPQHAGDLPPIFSSRGFGWYSALSGRFDLNSVIGRTVIIHRNPDDFTTQPSGNSGEMIACGVIRRV